MTATVRTGFRRIYFSSLPQNPTADISPRFQFMASLGHTIYTGSFAWTRAHSFSKR